MRISVKLDVSQNKGNHTFDLEDFDVTEKEWEELDDVQRREIIENAVFELPEQPYWMVDTFEEI